MQIRSASEKHGGENRGYSADLPEKVPTRLYARLIHATLFCLGLRASTIRVKTKYNDFVAAFGVDFPHDHQLETH